MFDKIKDVYQLQKQAKEMSAALQKTHIEAEVNGVVLTLNGEMELVELIIPEDILAKGSKFISQSVKNAHEKAHKKAKQVAAEKMKGMMGGNLPF
ncbi:MAG TPA: YbaB/EbfC family nucleoid-associated protein [Candidatus Gracilibacteria bacterium]|nr:YbaB/EbfC family nucleoid-associated protein [Candidatus Gracilibacteria bacterium]